MRSNVVVIGTGGIGQRHLQSLYEIKEDISIYVVEINTTLVNELSKKYDEVHFYNNFEELPSVVDVAIIATSSNVRKVVFENLIKGRTVNNVIFEKVLFQCKQDYYIVDDLLKKNGVNAWVNCARREWDSYNWLVKHLANVKTFNVSYVGGNWGLGCNAIHILDLIELLTSDSIDSINADYLLPGLIESKRKGFHEFFGTLIGCTTKGFFFSINCMESNSTELLIVEADDMSIIVDETSQRVRIKNAQDNWKEESFNIAYQSQLTAKVVKSILTGNGCRLSKYEASMELHLKLLDSLRGYFANEGIEEGISPIT